MLLTAEEMFCCPECKGSHVKLPVEERTRRTPRATCADCGHVALLAEFVWALKDAPKA